MDSTWGFAGIWNQSLDKPRERPTEKRERIWASELGGAYIDRYLKMNGVKPTNPPNARSRRKFEAGNIWEYIVSLVLKRAGILISQQDYLQYQYPDLLPVTGKLDFMAGGKPDYDTSLKLIESDVSLPTFISDVSRNLIEEFREKFPNGLNEIVLEIKSCSSFMFEVYEERKKPNPNHMLQNYHYLKALDKREGHVVYICRDDARIAEYGIFNPSPIEEEYKKDIEAMTHYFKTNEEPTWEKPIVQDEETQKFSTNYKVAYSGYLTHLYGFKDQKEFDDTYKPRVERWNRVIGRMKEGKEMTKNNLEAVEEMAKEGFTPKIPQEVK